MDTSEQDIIPMPLPVALARPSRVHVLMFILFSLVLFVLVNSLPILVDYQMLAMRGDAANTNGYGYTAFYEIIILGFLLSILIPPLAGALSDRRSCAKRRVFLRMGVLVTVVGVLAMAYVSSNPSLLAFSYALAEVGASILLVAYWSLLPDTIPRKWRGLIVGLTISMQVVGQVILSFITHFASYDHPASPVMNLILAALLLCSLFLLFGLKEPRAVETEAQTTRISFLGRRFLVVLAVLGGAWLVLFLANHLTLAGSDVADASLRIQGKTRLVLLGLLAIPCILWAVDFRPRRSVGLLFVLSANLLLWSGAFVLDSLLGEYAADILRISPGITSFTTAVLVMCGCALVGGWLSDRLGRKPLLALAAGLMALCSLVLFVPTASVYFVSVTLWAAGTGLMLSVGWAFLADALPERTTHGRDVGVWLMLVQATVIFENLAQIILTLFHSTTAPYVLSHFTSVAGYEVVFLLAILCCIAGAICALHARRSA